MNYCYRRSKPLNRMRSNGNLKRKRRRNMTDIKKFDVENVDFDPEFLKGLELWEDLVDKPNSLLLKRMDKVDSENTEEYLEYFRRDGFVTLSFGRIMSGFCRTKKGVIPFFMKDSWNEEDTQLFLFGKKYRFGGDILLTTKGSGRYSRPVILGEEEEDGGFFVRGWHAPIILFDEGMHFSEIIPDEVGYKLFDVMYRNFILDRGVHICSEAIRSNIPLDVFENFSKIGVYRHVVKTIIPEEIKAEEGIQRMLKMEGITEKRKNLIEKEIKEYYSPVIKTYKELKVKFHD